MEGVSERGRLRKRGRGKREEKYIQDVATEVETLLLLLLPIVYT